MVFADDVVQQVWNKAKHVSEENERRGFRKDECDAWISRSQYGNRNSQYGWEIDHIRPKAKGGADAPSNLRPLQWENNASKSDDRLVCVVTARDTENVPVGKAVR